MYQTWEGTLGLPIREPEASSFGAFYSTVKTATCILYAKGAITVLAWT